MTFKAYNLVHYSQMLKAYCDIFAFIFNCSFFEREEKCPNARQVTRKLDCFDLGPQGATKMIPFQELTKPTTYPEHQCKLNVLLYTTN